MIAGNCIVTVDPFAASTISLEVTGEGGPSSPKSVSSVYKYALELTSAQASAVELSTEILVIAAGVGKPSLKVAAG